MRARVLFLPLARDAAARQVVATRPAVPQAGAARLTPQNLGQALHLPFFCTANPTPHTPHLFPFTRPCPGTQAVQTPLPFLHFAHAASLHSWHLPLLSTYMPRAAGSPVLSHSLHFFPFFSHSLHPFSPATQAGLGLGLGSPFLASTAAGRGASCVSGCRAAAVQAAAVRTGTPTGSQAVLAAWPRAAPPGRLVDTQSGESTQGAAQSGKRCIGPPKYPLPRSPPALPPCHAPTASPHAISSAARATATRRRDIVGLWWSKQLGSGGPR